MLKAQFNKLQAQRMSELPVSETVMQEIEKTIKAKQSQLIRVTTGLR